jgi:Flp pilus assembly pilin Flp
MRKLFGLIRDDEGQDLAEYALLLSLIALVAIAGMTLLGDRISTVLSSIAGVLR